MAMAVAMIPRTRTKLIPILAALALLPFLLYIDLGGWGFDDDDYDDQRILEPWVPSQGRQLEITTSMAPRGKVTALTSWYTFNLDPQRKVQVSSESIAYINNLYTTATHFGVPLVVFHDALTEEFVAKYTNEYVSFEHAIPDPSMSTNDFRFFPYLEYVKEHDLDSVLMVDASDVFFNSDPFSYIQEHEGPQDQLFMSYDSDHFQHSSFMVSKCYGTKEALSWPKGLQMYNAGVWGGKGPAIQCVLKCINNQLDGPLRGHGNCDMPAVNYCVHFGQCQSESAPIVHKNPKFVNPMWRQCTDSFSVVHNKCSNTQYLTTIKIEDGEVVMDIREKTKEEIEARKAKRNEVLRLRAMRAMRAERKRNRKDQA